jgi:hypothetical protein
MRAMSVVLALFVAMGFCFTGCSDNAETVAGANEIAIANTPGDAISLAKGAPVHSANGNAQIPIKFGVGVVPKDWDVLRVFTFNAREYSDGSYGGRCLNNPAPAIPGTHLNGEVTQLLVDGNKAKILFVDGEMDYAFVVIDNGEGNNVDPDMVSPLWGAPVGSQDAADMHNRSVEEALAFIGGIAPLYIGNAQVR